MIWIKQPYSQSLPNWFKDFIEESTKLPPPLMLHKKNQGTSQALRTRRKLLQAPKNKYKREEYKESYTPLLEFTKFLCKINGLGKPL